MVNNPHGGLDGIPAEYYSPIEETYGMPPRAIFDDHQETERGVDDNGVLTHLSIIILDERTILDGSIIILSTNGVMDEDEYEYDSEEDGDEHTSADGTDDNKENIGTLNSDQPEPDSDSEVSSQEYVYNPLIQRFMPGQMAVEAMWALSAGKPMSLWMHEEDVDEDGVFRNFK